AGLEGGLDDGAGGDADEEPLLLGEAAGHREARLAVHDDLAIEDGLVEDLGDEALLERAEALDHVAGVRRRGDDADVRLLLLEVAAGAGEGAAGAETGDEHGGLGQVAQDLGAGALVV